MKNIYTELTSEKGLQPKKETIELLLFYSKMMRTFNMNKKSFNIVKQVYN